MIETMMLALLSVKAVFLPCLAQTAQGKQLS